MNILKKILMILICVIFSNNLSSQLKNPSYKKDNYVSNFAATYGSQNKYIKYEEKDDELILFADPSTLVITILGGLGSLSLAAIPLSFKIPTSQWYEKLIQRIFCVAMGGVSFLCLKKAIKDLTMKFSKTQYISFDKEGAKLWNERIFFWKNINDINLQTIQYKDKVHSNYSPYPNSLFIGGYTHTYRHNVTYLSFYDEYKTTVLKVSSSDYCLPIMLANLSALAEHYWQKYKS